MVESARQESCGQTVSSGGTVQEVMRYGKQYDTVRPKTILLRGEDALLRPVLHSQSEVRHGYRLEPWVLG